MLVVAYVSKEKQLPPAKVGGIVMLTESVLPIIMESCEGGACFPWSDEKFRPCEINLPDGGVLNRPAQLFYPQEIANVWTRKPIRWGRVRTVSLSHLFVRKSRGIVWDPLD